MSVSKLLPALILLYCGSLLAGSDHYVLIGGGGEPAEKQDTIFDGEIQNLGTYLNQSKKWDIDVSFNGGHPKTEQIVSQIGPNRSFTNTSYEAVIKSYKDKILSGEIKSGDQLLIQISTHGAMNGFYKSGKEKSHSVATADGAATDLLTLKGSKLVSLDELQELIDLAAQKNVKLGILDFSCHSGNSLALANPKTCIISSSGTNHFAWSGPSGFSSTFTKTMKPGMTLEDVFLQALKDKNDPGFPMISSPVGKSIQGEMYKGITPFLYEWRPKVTENKLSPYLEKEVIDNQCREIPEFQEIINFSKEAEALIAFTGESVHFDSFRKAVTDYYNFQTKIRQDLNALDIPVLKESHRFCSTATAIFSKSSKFSQEICDSKSTEELLATDYPKAKSILEEQIKLHSNDPISLSINKANLENLNKEEAKLAELGDIRGNVEKYKNYYTNFSNIEKNSRDMALQVEKEAVGVYERLYRAQSKQNSTPNPCKDFVL